MNLRQHFSIIMHIYLGPGGCITSYTSIYFLPGQYPVVNTDKERIIIDVQNTVIFIVNFWLSKYKLYLLNSSQSILFNLYLPYSIVHLPLIFNITNYYVSQ